MIIPQSQQLYGIQRITLLFFSNDQILYKRIVDILELERTLKTVQSSHFSDE